MYHDCFLNILTYKKLQQEQLIQTLKQEIKEMYQKEQLLQTQLYKVQNHEEQLLYEINKQLDYLEKLENYINEIKEKNIYLKD